MAFMLKLIFSEVKKGLGHHSKSYSVESVIEKDSLYKRVDKKELTACFYIESPNFDETQEIETEIRELITKTESKLTVFVFTNHLAKLLNLIYRHEDVFPFLLHYSESIKELDDQPGTPASRFPFNNLSKLNVLMKKIDKNTENKVHDPMLNILINIKINIDQLLSLVDKNINNQANDTNESTCYPVSSESEVCSNKELSTSWDLTGDFSELVSLIDLLLKSQEVASPNSQKNSEELMPNFVFVMNQVKGKLREDKKADVSSLEEFKNSLESLKEKLETSFKKQVLIYAEDEKGKSLLREMRNHIKDKNVYFFMRKKINNPDLLEKTTRSGGFFSYEEKYYVPRIIHYIWVGKEIPEKYLKTMIELATQVQKKGYRVFLWVDDDSKLETSLKLAKLEGFEAEKLFEMHNIFTDKDLLSKEEQIICKSRSIIDGMIADDPALMFPFIVQQGTDDSLTSVNLKELFGEMHLRESKNLLDQIKHTFLHGTKENPYPCYAKTSDYLRLIILNQFGGHYFDCDVSLFHMKPSYVKKFPEADLVRAPFMATGNHETGVVSNNILSASRDHRDLESEIINSLVKTVLSSQMDVFKYSNFDSNEHLLYIYSPDRKPAGLTYFDSMFDPNATDVTVCRNFFIKKRVDSARVRSVMDFLGPGVSRTLSSKYKAGRLIAGQWTGEIVARSSGNLLFASQIPGGVLVRIANNDEVPSDHWSQKGRAGKAEDKKVPGV